MAIESQYEKQQRPFRIRKSLRELVHKPRTQKLQKNAVALPPLPIHDSEDVEYAYDVLYECQRGSLAVGYSSKTLLQFDPNPWCDADMRFTPMNIDTYQLPDPTWEWVSKDWMIDMTGDVDEAGWQYSLKFHGAVWHGNYKHFRSFVRRRRWIRLRCRPTTAKNELSEEPPSTIKIRTLVDVEEEQEAISLLSPEASSSVVPLREQEIMERLHKCRLDRERLSVLDNVIKSLLPGLEEKLLEKASIFLDLFDYEDSKCKFLSSLLDKKYGSSFNQFKLTEQEKKAIESLQFYYDVQTILDQIDPEQKVY